MLFFYSDDSILFRELGVGYPLPPFDAIVGLVTPGTTKLRSETSVRWGPLFFRVLIYGFHTTDYETLLNSPGVPRVCKPV